jgi:hypothetical protein
LLELIRKLEELIHYKLYNYAYNILIRKKEKLLGKSIKDIYTMLLSTA